MTKIYFFIGVFLLSLCYSFQPEITLYTGYDYSGDGIILRSKTPNLAYKAPTFINNWKSYCFQGWWLFYRGLNYDATGFISGTLSWSKICRNETNIHDSDKSVRYLGPADTTIISISLYSGNNWAGDELIITAPAYTNIPFNPTSLFVTGNYAWTLFSEENFSGNTTCVVPNSSGIYYSNTAPLIRSVYRGCLNRRIDTYIYATDDLETTDNF